MKALRTSLLRMYSHYRLRQRASLVILLMIDRTIKSMAKAPGSTRPDLIESRIITGMTRGRYLALRRTHDSISMTLGRFERWVTESILLHARPGSVVYDIGASFGYHTLLLSQIVGNNGRVYAFEPDPTDRDILARNLKINRAHNTVIEPTAVGVLTGTVRFASFSYPGVSHIATGSTPEDARISTVDCITLDDFVFEKSKPPPTFIKVDVEGGELDVLSGAHRLLKESRPVIVCEVRKGDTWRRIQAILADHNYSFRILHDGADLMDVIFLPNY
jgi:FkbM family methyltransferase